MPSWVVDYVLVHELAHLQIPGHGADFWALVDHYPRAQRARGYLEGAAAAAGLDLTDDDVDESSEVTELPPASGRVRRGERTNRQRLGRADNGGLAG
jgi:hypothetical protein